MAASRKLKVFRTAIGFHDAYVAAPSKKAALAAWGSAKDLFAIGSAEQVTDPELMHAPLTRPGEVIKLARGSAEDHLKAADKDTRPRQESRRSIDDGRAPRSKPAPPPSRRRLQQAEMALSEFEADAETKLAALRAKEAALARERAAIEADLAKTRKGLETKVEKARTSHNDALSRWRDRQ